MKETRESKAAWPSGLRRRFKAPVRKGTSSNLVAVTPFFLSLPFPWSSSYLISPIALSSAAGTPRYFASLPSIRSNNAYFDCSNDRSYLQSLDKHFSCDWWLVSPSPFLSFSPSIPPLSIKNTDTITIMMISVMLNTLPWSIDPYHKTSQCRWSNDF